MELSKDGPIIVNASLARNVWTLYAPTWADHTHTLVSDQDLRIERINNPEAPLAAVLA